MRRKTVKSLALFVLVMMVWVIPIQVASAGDYGCNSRYYSASAPTYSSPTVSATYTPSPYYGNVYSPLAIPVTIYDSTFFRVAPDLAQARLAQEAASQAVNQFKAEIAKQAEDQKRVVKEAEDAAFKQQVLQLLATRGTPGGEIADPERARILAENAAMRATLAKIASSPPQAVTPPQNANSANVGAVGPGAPPIPPAAQAPGDIVAQVKSAVTNSCMPCHGGGTAGRMNLSDPTKLFYEDLTDCINRMISDDPGLHMPKGKESVPLEVVSSFHKLSVKAPHRK